MIRSNLLIFRLFLCQYRVHLSAAINTVSCASLAIPFGAVARRRSVIQEPVLFAVRAA